VKYLIIMIVLFLIFNCSGKKPQPDWSAEEYYRYAKKQYNDEEYYDAVNTFTIIVLRYAGSAYADSAQYFLATSHYYMDEFFIAAEEYKKLINTMPQSPLLSSAQFMLAESYYQMSPRSALDQENTYKAIKEYQTYLEDYPSHQEREQAEKKILELRERLAKKHWQNAILYRKMHRYTSCIIYCDIILNSFYDSDYAEYAQYEKAQVYLAMNDIQKAKEELLVFKDKFPNSQISEKVDQDLDNILKLEGSGEE
jgi:outer membrane protein assembly factor BamD